MKLYRTDRSPGDILVVLEGGKDVDNIGVGAVTLWCEDNREAVLAINWEGLLGGALTAGRTIAGVGGCPSQNWRGGRCLSCCHPAPKKVQNVAIGVCRR